MTSDTRKEILNGDIPPGNQLWVYEHEGIKYPGVFAGNPEEHLQNILNMTCEEDDTVVCSYPKSGTHWVLEITSMLIRRRTAHTSKFNVLDIIPSSAMTAISSPRLFMSHLRFNQLPEQFRRNRSKVIYCVRNPKDIAVSMYNFCRAYKDMQFTGTWDQFFKEFCNGNVSYSSWFDHVRSWENARKEDEKYPILFVHYEDMKKDTEKGIQRLAKFLDITIDRHTLESIVENTSLDSMRNHTYLYHPYPPEIMDPNHQTNLFRKGEVGDWKRWFTKDQNKTFDKLYDEKMKGSQLRLQFQ